MRKPVLSLSCLLNILCHLKVWRSHMKWEDFEGLKFYLRATMIRPLDSFYS